MFLQSKFAHLFQRPAALAGGLGAALLALLAWLLFMPTGTHAATPTVASAATLPTIVLVHGAWADASSWNDVTRRLQARGHTVVAVQNQLNSLADDVGQVTRALSQIEGPVVLVGHSWGGTVITQAGASPKVAALVYVAAFAPDAGQSTNDLQAGAPVPGYAQLLRADEAGYLWFPQGELPGWFAQDLARPQAAVLAAAQNPIRASAFDDKVSVAAWQSKPSWYLLASDDRMIAPELQRRMASRIKAQVTTVATSHVPFLTKPAETTALILKAAQSVTPRPLP